MKIMLVGRTGAGKTTLTQKLNGENVVYQKTQMISYEGNIIDTPGEYIERKFFSRLTVIASDVDIVALVQSAQDEETFFPPNFSTMFNGKSVIGIVTKKDLNFNCIKAEEFLKLAGVEEIYYTGLDDEKEILKLRERIG